VAGSFDYSVLDDTALAHQLHNLAEQIAAARGANDVDQVKALWAEFQDAATEYASRDNLSGLDSFLNHVQDSTEAFLAEAAATAGNVTASLLKPLLVPLGILVVLAIAAYVVYRKVK